MKHNVDYYIGVMDELEEDFNPVVNLFEKIEDMVRPSWSLPADFTAAIKDVMAVVDTAPSDAINSGAIALSGSLPIFNVSPYAANVAEYDRVQKLEDALSWHFKRANRRGDGKVMFDIAWSSLVYNTICVRTDDLAHICPKDQSSWTPLQKRAWANGRFIHKVVNPKFVRYIHSDMGLVLVGHVENIKVKDAIAHWELYEGNKTPEGRRIASALADLKKKVDIIVGNGSKVNVKDLFLEQTYCIDDDKLMIWGNLTGSGVPDVTSGTAEFVFADQDNPYGFIPWSIRVAGTRLESDIAYRVNPLLAPLYWSKSWDKLNLAKSIIFSEPIRRARNPRGISITPSGETPPIDYENGQDIALQSGSDYKPFQPLTMDPQALGVVQALEAAMNRTTGASMIGDTTKISSNTPFATFSAMVKVALSRLDKQREIMADSSVDMACNMLWWVNKTDVPLSSYAESNKRYRSGTNVPAGMKIDVTKEDYDLNALGISAKVQPSTPTDRMEQLNMAIQLSTKLNVPASQLLEEMGYENVGLMYELWAREFLQTAEIQAKAAGMQAEATTAGQLAAQMQAQQSQQEQQQQQAPQGQPGEQPQGAGQGVSNQAFGSLGGMGQGMNPAMSGTAPANAAPTMTREAITGQNYSNQGQ